MLDPNEKLENSSVGLDLAEQASEGASAGTQPGIPSSPSQSTVRHDQDNLESNHPQEKPSTEWLDERFGKIESTMQNAKRHVSNLDGRVYQLNERLVRLEREQNMRKERSVSIRRELMDQVILVQEAAGPSSSKLEKNMLDQEKKRLKKLSAQFVTASIEKICGPSAAAEPTLKRLSEVQSDLLEMMRRNHEKNPQLRSINKWLSGDKNAKAMKSVERLAKNAVFANGQNLTDAHLTVCINLMHLMTQATWILTFHSQLGEYEDTDFTTYTDVTTYNDNHIKKAIMDELRQTLSDAPTYVYQDARGLVGSENKTMQLWGKVLMIVATVALCVVSTFALMSLLGMATPAVLVPFFAAMKASSIVSATLNLVATKLVVDTNVAAMITLGSTASVLGVFGQALHMRGAPSSLKRDIDHAVQNLEAVLSDTEVAKYGR